MTTFKNLDHIKREHLELRRALSELARRAPDTDTARKIRGGADLEYLMLATAAVESGWRARRQRRGIALGVCQVEPDTALWLFKKYPFLLPSRFGFKMDEAKALDKMTKPEGDRLNYQTARMRYYTVPHALPEWRHWRAMFDYYKKHFNTRHGATTLEGWCERANDVDRYFSLGQASITRQDDDE